MNQLVTNQVSDIRDDPWSAGLDELVVVKLVQVIRHHRKLLFDQHQQRLERASRLGQQLIQLLLLLHRQRGMRVLKDLQLRRFLGTQ